MRHGHFLHDIDLLDENGLEYMPYSAYLEGRVDIKDSGEQADNPSFYGIDLDSDFNRPWTPSPVSSKLSIEIDEDSEDRHFLHDIDLLDENGLKYMPHSASFEGRVDIEDSESEEQADNLSFHEFISDSDSE